jgi:hypothetical protein
MQFTSETVSVEIAVSSQTLVDRTCFEKDHVKQTKKDIAERWILHLLIPTLVSSLSGLVGNLVSNGGR